MTALEYPGVDSWDRAFSNEEAALLAEALESASVVVFPSLPFALREDETALLAPSISDGRSKNVSLAHGSARLAGTRDRAAAERLVRLLKRFEVRATGLVRAIYPRATPDGTSFRPVEAAGRAGSWRSDDQRLHVDAFPARPTRGARILRVFTNIAPDRERVWRVGEPFEAVARRFGPRLGRPSRAAAVAFQALGVTRGRRSPYDQLMLRLHDAMKRDAAYQASVPASVVRFPPGATWLAFTDLVSHAVVSGQFVVEQTLFVDAASCRRPEASPVAVLGRVLAGLSAP